VGALVLATANRSGGLGSNEAHFGQKVTVEPGVDPDRLTILFDPQTSGGLLVAVRSESAEQVRTALIAAGVAAVRVGSNEPAMPGTNIVVRP
jgi:selenide,water dikinase